MTDTLDRAIARFRLRPAPADDVVARVSAAAFRAVALERLRAVERDLVRPFKFTAASKSRLGFALLAAVNGGCLKAYSPDGSSEHRAFWREIELARVAYRPNQTMNLLQPALRGARRLRNETGARRRGRA